MTEHGTTNSQAPAGRIEIFDPPMCCPSGVCGPTVDQALLDVNDMLHQLGERGVVVQRYQMGTQPQAFVSNPQVYRLIQEQRMAALPITVVNGQVIKVGSYPTFSEVQSALDERKS